MEIAPSILSADFSKLNQEISSISYLVNFLHIDVMDGHFVPNITIGPDVIKSIRNDYPNLIFDTHLMISEPLKYIKRFKDAGADILTFHLEASNNPLEVIKEIKKNDVKVGISIKPGTDVKALIPYLDKVDLVLIMSVEPGFGGQSFMPSAILKISFLDEWREKNNLKYLIEVDGGINDKTAKLVKEAGVDIVVAGSYIFANPDRGAKIESLK